jgi:hypothetical protein
MPLSRKKRYMRLGLLPIAAAVTTAITWNGTPWRRKGFDAAHGQGVGAVAVAEAAVGVVDRLGTIKAHAHHDAVAAEARAPGVVDQRAVGLDALLDHHPIGTVLGQAALDDRRGFVVVSCRAG